MGIFNTQIIKKSKVIVKNAKFSRNVLKVIIFVGFIDFILKLLISETQLNLTLVNIYFLLNTLMLSVANHNSTG